MSEPGVKVASSAKSARLVWIVVLIGILMAVCTLCVVKVVLSSLHEQRGKIASVESAADQLVDTISHGSAEAQDDSNHLLTLKPTQTSKSDWDKSTEQAVVQFAAANQNSGVAVNTHDIRQVIVAAIALRDACKKWGEEVVANQAAITTGKKLTDSSLSALRALLNSEEGRQRLLVAKKIRQFRVSSGPVAEDLATQIVSTIGPSDQLTEITVEMDNLSLMSEQLVGESEADRLADIKDNQFCGSLIRLRAAIDRTRSTSPTFQASLETAVEAFEKNVFGDGYLTDNDQHFIRLGNGGLYTFCLHRLELQQKREALRDAMSIQAEHYKLACARFERQYGAWREEMTIQVEQKLTAGWLILLIISLCGGVVLAAMGTRIARSIRRQFIRIEAVTMDLERTYAQMAAIHNTSLDGFITLDHAWNALDINHSVEQTFGFNRDQVIGRALGHLIAPRVQSATDPLTPLLSEKADALSHEMRAPILGRRIEVLGKHANGQTFAAEIAITAAAVKGAPLYVASVRDITDQKRAEAEREELHDRLLTASRQAGMAEVATGVLHNVGNILNSVNVSAGIIADKIRQSEVASLKKAGDMLRAHLEDLPAYLTHDPRGKHLPPFLIEVAGCLEEEHTAILPELEVVSRGLEHIKHIITTQQSHAKGGVVLQRIKPADLINTAMDIHRESFTRHQVQVTCDLGDLQELTIDKHKVLQILVNLITNAKNAVCEGRPIERSIKITLSHASLVGGRPGIQFRVQDNGTGIAPENLAKIFAHGFTTRKEGHGFGLHSAANAAGEMNGTIRVESDGLGKGAAFTLEIPMQAESNADDPSPRQSTRAAA